MKLSLYFVFIVSVLLAVDQSTASEAGLERRSADEIGARMDQADKQKSDYRPEAAAAEIALKDVPARNPQAAEILWESEQQKTVCTAYTQEILVHFMKGRHSSINSKCLCEAATHAVAFVRVSRKIQSDCPQGMLEGLGYTDRIQRNFTFMQALGTERCAEGLRADNHDHPAWPY